jgi:hypothetical protein
MSGMTNTKHKPKSCSCQQCRHGGSRKEILNQKERAFRRKWKIALNTGQDTDSFEPTVYAGYTD